MWPAEHITVCLQTGESCTYLDVFDTTEQRAGREEENANITAICEVSLGAL